MRSVAKAVMGAVAMFAVAGASAVLADGASGVADGQVQKAGNSSWVQQISLNATGSEIELVQ